MSCEGCVQEAKIKNRVLNELLITAKKQAIEEGKVKAICEDQINGLFITSAEVAIREHFQIKQFVSSVQ